MPAADMTSTYCTICQGPTVTLSFTDYLRCREHPDCTVRLIEGLCVVCHQTKGIERVHGQRLQNPESGVWTEP